MNYPENTKQQHLNRWCKWAGVWLQPKTNVPQVYNNAYTIYTIKHLAKSSGFPITLSQPGHWQ